MNLVSKLQSRDCPVCQAPAETAGVFLRRAIDEKKITAASFASRKEPEFMSYGFVKCRTCATLFANQIPATDILSAAYHDASYDTEEEAELAAATYATALKPYIALLPERGTALEIGTGTGAFLAHLKQAGFQNVIGIEPSGAALDAARLDIRPLIRHGIFDSKDFPDSSLSLVCCFQTLEHVPEPRAFVKSAFTMLKPGGMLALITHDYSARINRWLGARSPIIDIQHLQLFNADALHHLMTASGFTVKAIDSFYNVYPFGYWLRLLPLPTPIKKALLRGVHAAGLGHKLVKLNVGNIVAVAFKP